MILTEGLHRGETGWKRKTRHLLNVRENFKSLEENGRIQRIQLSKQITFIRAVIWWTLSSAFIWMSLLSPGPNCKVWGLLTSSWVHAEMEMQRV